MKTTRGVLMIAALLLATALLIPGPARADESKLLAQGNSWTIHPNVGTVTVTINTASTYAQLTGSATLKPKSGGADVNQAILVNTISGREARKTIRLDGYIITSITFKANVGDIQIDAVYSGDGM